MYRALYKLKMALKEAASREAVVMYRIRVLKEELKTLEHELELLDNDIVAFDEAVKIIEEEESYRAQES